jgi:chemotaxis protein CheD
MSPDSKPDPVLRPRMAAALQRLKDSRQGGALEVIGEIVSQLLGCEEHALLVLEENGTHLVPVAAMGLSPERPGRPARRAIRDRPDQLYRRGPP